jgi:hypothetical protein
MDLEQSSRTKTRCDNETRPAPTTNKLPVQLRFWNEHLVTVLIPSVSPDLHIFASEMYDMYMGTVFRARV